MVVIQRPFAWTAPTACACGHKAGTVVQLSPEPLLDKFGTPGFEETSTHLRQRDRDRHGCCTPTVNHNWHTRNLKCELPVACGAEFVELRYAAHSEQLSVEVMPPMGGAVVCAPRFGRKLASLSLASGYLGDWLSHYAGRDVTHALLYSDECLEEVLTPAVLAHESTKSGLQARVVDISRAREFPTWYHNQVLAMRDCWGRAVAGGASWMLSMDADEMLLVPKGWSQALAFASAAALSFGSSVPCASGPQAPCLPGSQGHRKYALRSRAVKGAPPLLPPAFIHGDPREVAFSTAAGMFVMHFSQCPLEHFRGRAGHDGDWLPVVLRDRGWLAATIEGLQNSTGGAKLATCPLVKPPWAYH
jgi:hypothetical protein